MSPTSCAVMLCASCVKIDSRQLCIATMPKVPSVNAASVISVRRRLRQMFRQASASNTTSPPLFEAMDAERVFGDVGVERDIFVLDRGLFPGLRGRDDDLRWEIARADLPH